MPDKVRLYFHPSPTAGVSDNPYTERMMAGLADVVELIHPYPKIRTGAFSFIARALSIDVLWCNWIENLPERRFGRFQAIFFFLFVVAKPLHRIKLVWTMHNKVSHSQLRRGWKSWLTATMLRRADLIFTHAQDGRAYAAEVMPGSEAKVRFFHHPVAEFTGDQHEEAEFTHDVLIWGAMRPYKGVPGFLEALRKAGAERRFRVLIWGRFSDPSEFDACMQLASDRTEIRNEFPSDEEVVAAHRTSRVIVFPYKAASVLSSGALMDSINSQAAVVGPDTGAFRDLHEAGLIEVYRDTDDIVPAIERAMETSRSGDALIERRKRFFAENGWDEIPAAMARVIRSELM